jgi:hypothetical protein
MTVPYYGHRRDRDQFLRDFKWLVREKFGLPLVLSFERMVEDLHTDLRRISRDSQTDSE